MNDDADDTDYFRSLVRSKLGRIWFKNADLDLADISELAFDGDHFCEEGPVLKLAEKNFESWVCCKICGVAMKRFKC